MIFMADGPAKPGLEFPSLLEVIARGATRYFLIVFSVHLVLEIPLTLGRVGAAVSLLGYG